MSKRLIFFICVLSIGVFAGITSAIFLILLDFCTNFREKFSVSIYFLPIAGMLVVWLYNQCDSIIQKGNVLIISEIKSIKTGVPFMMAPLILVTTLITHLFGGSAGREGTAVQMSGALTDTLSRKLNLEDSFRQNLLLCSIAAGFASVFGTPWAAVFFAFEVSKTKPLDFALLFSVVTASLIGYFVCGFFPIIHTHYSLGILPNISIQSIGYVAFASIFFGLTAYCFVELMSFSSNNFKRIQNPYLRVFIGGSIVLIAFVLLGNGRLHGLGIQTILEAFVKTEPLYSFAIKMALTIITLSAGMKGGEVTPLFLIGSLLGSALSAFLPLPTAFLAGLGFIAVFAGASKTPLACFVLGLEIFGFMAWPYLLISCGISYLFSGKNGIYSH